MTRSGPTLTIYVAEPTSFLPFLSFFFGSSVEESARSVRFGSIRFHLVPADMGILYCPKPYHRCDFFTQKEKIFKEPQFKTTALGSSKCPFTSAPCFLEEVSYESKKGTQRFRKNRVSLKIWH